MPPRGECAHAARGERPNVLTFPTEETAKGLQRLHGEDLPRAHRDLALDASLSKPLANLRKAPSRAKR
eukprot:3844545-Alexandrium_andersonii.AAC.1